MVTNSKNGKLLLYYSYFTNNELPCQLDVIVIGQKARRKENLLQLQKLEVIRTQINRI